MAKAKSGSLNSSTYKVKPKVRRPGVHSKTKTSRTKGSKLYVKKYKGQGK